MGYWYLLYIKLGRHFNIAVKPIPKNKKIKERRRKMKKFTSILISMVMLLSLIPTMAFALTDCTASDLQWDSQDAGAYVFQNATEDGEFCIRLYKDGTEIQKTSYSHGGNTTVKGNFKFDILEAGSGTYYYTVENVDENDIATSNAVQSGTFQYTKPSAKLDTVGNISLKSDVLSWDSVDGASIYWVEYGFVYSGNEYQEMYRVTGTDINDTHSVNLAEDGVYEEFQGYVDYWGSPLMDDAALAFKIYAVPADITQNDMSVVSFNRRPSSGGSTTPSATATPAPAADVFEASLLAMKAQAGAVAQIEYINYLIPDEMVVGLDYASDVYEEYIEEDAKITFTKNSEATVHTQSNSPLIYTGLQNDNKCYTLDITVPDGLESGVYKVDIELPIAVAKEATNVKPYHFTINQFLVDIDPDFEFLNITQYEENMEPPVPMTQSKNVSIQLNSDAVNNFTKYTYWLNDSEQGPFNISGDTISVPLDTTQSFQDVMIAFGNSDIKEDYYGVFHSIIYDSRHTLTFMVNGEVYGEVLTFFAGDSLANVEAPGTPQVEGYRFIEWEQIPETMPDENVVINAVMVQTSNVSGIVKYGETAVRGATVVCGEDSVTTNENGEFTITLPYGTCMLNVSYTDGETGADLKKAVSLEVNEPTMTMEEIILSEKGTSVTITEPAVKSVEGLDELLLEENLSDEDKEYLETPGNTITMDSKADPVPTNAPEVAAIATEMINTYSQYTAGIFIDLTVNKVKGGAENSSTPIEETAALVEFTVDIPLALQTKAEFIVLREHNGVVDAITTTPNADGEYIVVNGNILTIYAKKFSAYAVAGRDAAPVVPTNNGGGVSGYTVKFDTDGGNEIKSVRVFRNQTVTEPAVPIKEGYIFDGWYLDKEFTEKYDFSSRVTKAMTLHAKWKEIETAILLTIGQKDTVINGETVENDVVPKILNERVMLPIRFIAEALGAKVEWLGDINTVKITAENIEISFVISDNFAMVNGEKIELDATPFVENNRTYLPIRFVTENLGANVQWNPETQTVSITK